MDLSHLNGEMWDMLLHIIIYIIYNILLIIQRIIFVQCTTAHVQIKRKSIRLHNNHGLGNDDCYTNLHVQRFASVILIDLVVITLC